MPVRRSRVVAKPNFTRSATNSNTNSNTNTSNSGGTATSKEPKDTRSGNDGDQAGQVPNSSSNIESTSKNTQPVNDQNTSEVEHVEADSCSSHVETSSKVVDPSASLDPKKPAVTAGRRPRIQAKPSVARKSQRTTASLPVESSEGSTDKKSADETPHKDNNATPASPASIRTKPQVSDVGAGDTMLLSPGRQFRAKAKPNVIEANRARMRRISESLDLPLPPDHCAKSPLGSAFCVSQTAGSRRKRHASTPGYTVSDDFPQSVGADVSHSTVSVTSKDSSSESKDSKQDSSHTRKRHRSTGTPAAATAATAADHSTSVTDLILSSINRKKTAVVTTHGDNTENKNSSKAGEDEIKECEQMDSDRLSVINDDDEDIQEVPQPKPKKVRKVRRTVRSEEAPDPSKMTIKDLIYYQPLSNPLPEKPAKKPANQQESGKEVEKEADKVGEDEEGDEDEPNLAPQVMIGDDGEVIINQQSLTVRTEPEKRAIVYDDVTEEEESLVNYNSFREKSRCKFWTQTETNNFYKALAAIGTDFSLMCNLFPHRTRAEIKKKFKKEEKVNLGRVQRAMRGKLDFEHEPFEEWDRKREKEVEREKRKQEREADGAVAISNAKKGRQTQRTFYDLDNEGKQRAVIKRSRRLGHLPKERLQELAKTNSHHTVNTNSATFQSNHTTLDSSLLFKMPAVLLPALPHRITSSSHHGLPKIDSVFSQNQIVGAGMTDILLAKQRLGHFSPTVLANRHASPQSKANSPQFARLVTPPRFKQGLHAYVEVITDTVPVDSLSSANLNLSSAKDPAADHPQVDHSSASRALPITEL